MTGKELNTLKLEVFSPFVEESVFNAKFVTNNKHNYISERWNDLDKLLRKYNLPEDTFKDLYIRYREEIQNRILGIIK